MKTRLFLSAVVAALILGFIPSPAASSGLQVELDVQEVSVHAALVTLSWKVVIQSERDWEGCELLISFRDGQDREVHRITKELRVQKGRSEVTGHDICEAQVWKRTHKFSGKLNCGF
jgi:hypothetical protein